MLFCVYWDCMEENSAFYAMYIQKLEIFIAKMFVFAFFQLRGIFDIITTMEESCTRNLRRGGSFVQFGELRGQLEIFQWGGVAVQGIIGGEELIDYTR